MRFYYNQMENQIHGVTQLMATNISKKKKFTMSCSSWHTTEEMIFFNTPFQDSNMTVITDVAFFHSFLSNIQSYSARNTRGLNSY